MKPLKHFAGTFLAGSCILAATMSSNVIVARDPSSAADKLANIAWMQGSWTTMVDGDYLDEFWSPSHADSMIGMFRWSKKDKLWMSEMLSIVTEGDTIVLRIKHFDRAMIGWEDKDKPLTLPLVRQSKDESVFETENKAERLTYRKTGVDTMDVLLEENGKDRQNRVEFHFRRLG
jgi:hypothetical protein